MAYSCNIPVEDLYCHGLQLQHPCGGPRLPWLTAATSLWRTSTAAAVLTRGGSQSIAQLEDIERRIVELHGGTGEALRHHSPFPRVLSF